MGNVVELADVEKKEDDVVEEAIKEETAEMVPPSEEVKEGTTAEPKLPEPIHIMGGKKKVSRDELAQVMAQVVGNINQIADYLMQDVNTLYSKQIFPFQMRQAALEDLLEEKGLITKDEISAKATERYRQLEAQAKEIREREEAEAKEQEEATSGMKELESVEPDVVAEKPSK